jgi:ankyrin repeat protein
VRLLIERTEINVNACDDMQRTALHWASLKGCQGIVELFLGCRDVIVDPGDRAGRTAADSARQQRHYFIVLLLSRC